MPTFARWCAITLLTGTACGGGGGARSAPAPRATIESTTFAPTVAIPVAEATKLPSGVWYKDMNPGTGATAARDLNLTVRYLVYLPDGRLVSGGVDSQLTVKLNTESVIRGWYDAVPGMRVGGIRRLIVPPNLAYGSQGRGAIPPNAILVFDIELLAVR